MVSAFTPGPRQQRSGPLPPPLRLPAAPAAGVSASAILSPNDAVQVEVYQEDDLRTGTVISQDGTISLPLIGIVKVGWLDPDPGP